MEQNEYAEAQRGIWRRRAARAFTVLLALCVFAMVAKIALETDVFQVNFRLYYYAALAFNRGLNPYDSEVTRELAGGKFVLPCAYPPLSLNLLRPFALLDYAASYRCFLLLKCAAFALCLWLWQRKFLDGGIDNVFLFVCLIGFNYAIFYDLQAGNVSSLAQTVLWLGLYAYTRGRLGWFVVCTVAASIFKFTPAFFLVLLLMTDGRKKWLWCAVGLAAFALLHGASYALYPDLTRAFLENTGKVQGMVSASSALAENFPGAPATWPLIKTLFIRAGERLGTPLPNTLPVLAFAVLVLAVFGVTWLALTRSAEPDSRRRNILFVVLACLVYLLVTPRLMLYEYVLGLLPAYYVVRRLRYVNAAFLLVVLMVPAPITGRAPAFNFLIETCTNYYPLLVVYVVWALCVYDVIFHEGRHS
ncbi:MAG TPA: glycosyltransferase family 87 protein [Candidatus Hydrogenedentes bacterium]|nr:glycosyltransferase family 87 protein [Candidatus Hydrogenedentota bacterium]